MKESSSKRLWFILIFTFLILSSFLFVWWMSFANFKSSYTEIRQQYYNVVSDQVVSELEASIKYGKSLDSFYNIDSIFDKLTSLLPSYVRAAITNRNGEILYNTFEGDANQRGYLGVLGHQNTVAKLRSLRADQNYTTFSQGNYDIMILPIKDKSNEVIGGFTLIYRSSTIDDELQSQRSESFQNTLFVLIFPLVIILAFLLLVSVSEDREEQKPDAAKGGFWQKRRQMLLYAVPSIVVMLGIAVQSVMMYNQFQEKYKSAVSEGSRGILAYIGSSIKSIHDKGVPYEKMYGLSDYLTLKAKNTPIIWNIRIYNNMADTESVLKRENSWGISTPLDAEKEWDNLRLEIQTSQQYMDKQMLNMLLVFLVTMIVAGVIIFEAMRLPDILLFRRSKQFNTPVPLQFEKVTGSLRFASFVIFMGMYSSLPFSANLVRQWDASLFGLSTDIAASIPMTFELLAVMLFSALFARIFNNVNLKIFIIISGICIFIGNVLCSMTSDAVTLILYRILCGIGFAGVKHVFNNIVSYGSDGSERTSLNIASLNAGLLGGIMCGGSLGAVISNSLGISFTFLFTAFLVLLSVAILLYTMPWKLVKQNRLESGNKKESASGSMLRILLNGSVIKYILMVTLPLNVGLMFIVAFIPGYVQKMELPVILISYGYLVNGLIGIYTGPPLAKYLTRKLGSTACVSIMLLMGGVAIALIAFNPGVAIILLSTALMGLFDGFGSPVSMDYFIQMPGIQGKVETSSSLAMLGVLGNAIQMLSPVFYGWLLLMAANSGFSVILAFGAVYILFAIAFMVSLGRKPSEHVIAS